MRGFIVFIQAGNITDTQFRRHQTLFMFDGAHNLQNNKIDNVEINKKNCAQLWFIRQGLGESKPSMADLSPSAVPKPVDKPMNNCGKPHRCWRTTCCPKIMQWVRPSDLSQMPSAVKSEGQQVNCDHALSSRLMLTGCGVRSSWAKKLTRSSSSSQRNSSMRASCVPLRSATRRQ